MMEVCFNSGPTERTRQKEWRLIVFKPNGIPIHSLAQLMPMNDSFFVRLYLYLYVDSFFRFDAKHVQETKSQITFPEMTHNESHNEERIVVSGCVCVCVRRKPDPKM